METRKTISPLLPVVSEPFKYRTKIRLPHLVSGKEYRRRRANGSRVLLKIRFHRIESHCTRPEDVVCLRCLRTDRRTSPSFSHSQPVRQRSVYLRPLPRSVRQCEVLRADSSTGPYKRGTVTSGSTDLIK